VKSINVYPNTTVKFSVNDSDQCYSGNNFIFSNNSSISSGSFTNDWRFGDGNTSSSTSPTKSYATRGNYTVNLITTSNNGCKDTASKPVRIYSAPSVVFTLNNSNQCKRTNLFTTTNSSTNTDGSLSYSWNFGDGYKPSSSAPSHTYSSEGAYNIKLIATSSYGCVDSAVKSINVYPNTTVKFSVNDSDQCYAGNNFIFTNNSGISSGSFTNDWRFGDGNTSSSISPTKSYTARGNYNVLLITKTNNGCLDTASKPLRVYSAPAVSFSVNNNSQCLRSNLFTTSNNSTNSDGSLSYSWSFGDGFTSNNSAPVHSYSKNGNFNIRLVAQSAFGCEDSAALSITVSPQANAAFQMNDSDQCQRNNIFNFANTSAIASGSLNYSWDFGDGTYSAIASPVKVYANRGIYSVKLIAVSGAGCNDTLTKPLRVYDNPVADFSLNTTAQCMRNNLFISGNNSSVQDGTLNYVWTFGDGFSSNAATPYHSYATAGNYSVVLMVSSTYGCGDTSSVSIKIHPQVNLDFTVNNAQQCLEGNQVVVTDKSTISSGTFTYNWTFGDGGASNISQPSYTYASAGDFLLQLIAVSDNNCRDTASLGIKILDKPNVRMQVNNPIQCLKGNLFVLNNISAIQDTGIIFYWNYNNQKDYSKTLNLQYNIPGLYNVSLVAQNKIGCTATELKTLEVLPQPNLAFSTNNNIQCFAGNLFHCTNSSSISDGSLNFIWNFGDGQTSTLNSPDVQYFKSGDYEITLIGTSSAFCGDTINKKVTVLPTPKAEIKLLTAAELCLNNNEFVAISNSSVESGMVHLNWKCSDGYNTDDETFTHSFSDAGNYLLELLASSDDNCSDTQQISLNVNPSPVSKFATSGIYFCENGTVSMFDSASLPSGNLVVHWYKNDMELTDPNQIILSEYGEFVLKQIVNSDKNCTDTSETTIYVTGNPKLKFFYSPAIGCAGQTVFQFEDSSENPGGNAPIRKWNFTDSDSSERELVQRKFDTAGTYHAHLHLQNGACEADSAFTFVVLPKPTAAFIYQMEDRETVRFQALDENADITAFHWNLGDGVEADGIHCTHTYFRNDSFQTVLMVQNNSGCRDTTNNTIGIKSPNNILQNNALNFYVYPNPNNGQFTYKFEVLETQNITIDIRDILGRNIIYQKNWSSLIPGIYHETIDFNALGLAPGTYPFSIGSDTKKEVVKVIFAR
ncbi:MAG: PKD domain-containing protein, partial [Bacteroidetes bacterium]|nr:PKD domain-containing protein [Bacteroidota bacterium]